MLTVLYKGGIFSEMSYAELLGILLKGKQTPMTFCISWLLSEIKSNKNKLQLN